MQGKVWVWRVAVMKKSFGKFLLMIYLCSTVLSYAVLPKENMGAGLAAALSEQKTKLNPTGFGIMCINSAYPNLDIETAAMSFTESRSEAAKGEAGTAAGIAGGGADAAADGKKSSDAAIGTADYTDTDKNGKSSKSDVKVIANDTDDTQTRVFGKEPAVLIVHTHATESYLPSSEGNYHKKGKLNTVRDAGEVLAKTLNDAGVPCVHDMTLHDESSYNQAYSRSYETIEALLKKYPSIECVIDLHRDAVPGESTAATVAVDGKTCAKYSYVVSNAVETYASNLAFIKKMNETAADDYEGFTGKILERGYRYNQNLSSKYMLLEIGYNRNDIEDVRNTAELFGKILADTLKHS